MTRAPDQLAPSWLPRQQRRLIDRKLCKLFHSDVCSVCGSPFRHNSRTTGGLDAQGNVVLAGECCTSQVAATFVRGLYSDRKYDFLPPTSTGASINTDLTDEQIAVYQNVIADTDRRVERIERLGGLLPYTPDVYLLNYPWKSDDRDWFEQNPKRAHRVRLPLPGELDEEAAKSPAGYTLVVLVQQVEPGNWSRTGLCLNNKLLPVPNEEATGHALFEIAAQREAVPPDRRTLNTLTALIEKYKTQGESCQ